MGDRLGDRHREPENVETGVATGITYSGDVLKGHFRLARTGQRTHPASFRVDGGHLTSFSNLTATKRVLLPRCRLRFLIHNLIGSSPVAPATIT